MALGLVKERLELNPIISLTSLFLCDAQRQAAAAMRHELHGRDPRPFDFSSLGQFPRRPLRGDRQQSGLGRRGAARPQALVMFSLRRGQ